MKDSVCFYDMLYNFHIYFTRFTVSSKVFLMILFIQKDNYIIPSEKNP